MSIYFYSMDFNLTLFLPALLEAPFQPYAAWIGAISFSIILLTGGYAVFIKDHWDTETFFSSYFNIPLIFVLYFGYKFARKTKYASQLSNFILPETD